LISKFYIMVSGLEVLLVERRKGRGEKRGGRLQISFLILRERKEREKKKRVRENFRPCLLLEALVTVKSKSGRKEKRGGERERQGNSLRFFFYIFSLLLREKKIQSELKKEKKKRNGKIGGVKHLYFPLFLVFGFIQEITPRLIAEKWGRRREKRKKGKGRERGKETRNTMA